MDKPRNPRRAGGNDAARNRRGPATGGPGERPAAKGRAAGKPGMGPARSNTVGGVDRSLMERLEQEGMLTAEGRRVLGGPGAGPQAGRGKPARAQGRPTPDREFSDAPVRSGKPKLRPADRGAAAGTARRGKAPGAADRPAGVRPGTPEALVAERLHKVMAQAGVASRRHSEELIQAGRVTVNGRVVTELGIKVVAGRDIVEVDGRPLGKPEELIYLLLYKPKGYVTTLYDPQGRPKVVDILGGEVGQRVYPVGRLDFDTEGLLLLTNDGNLANALMHPAREVKKTYIAKVRGVPGPAKLKALESGVELDDGPTAPAEVKLIEAKGPNAATVSIRIHEGRNRQVRRMFEAVGHEVIHLKRTTMGPLHLGDMVVGQWRELTEREVNELRGAAGLAPNRGARIAAMSDQRKGRRGAARFDGKAAAYREETGAPTGRGRAGMRVKGPAPGPIGEFDGPRPAADRLRYGGGGRGEAPRYGDGPRPKSGGPRFGGGGGEVPRYGDNPRAKADRPRFGGGGGEVPRYGDNPRAKSDRPRFGGGGGEVPRYGDNPRAKSDRPRFGDSPKPRSGGGPSRGPKVKVGSPKNRGNR